MNSVPPKEKDLEGELFYCRVDSFRATKDYLQAGLCIRFIGIDAKSKKSIDQGDGIETFIMDIDLWQFAKLVYKRKPNRGTRKLIYSLEFSPEQSTQWYSLLIKPCHQERNYFYSTFSENPPVFFKIEDIQKVDPPNTGIQPSSAVPTHTKRSLASSGRWVNESTDTSQLTLCLEAPYFGGDFMFESFHVGQGMCSIVHNGTWGMLLDMGAGKPVLRSKYAKLHNDLSAATGALKSLNLLISHFDSDHWRLLAWDTNLRDKIQYIYVPSGDRPLAFYDEAIKNKVIEINDTTIKLATDASLRIYRSVPSKIDSNGQCLVTTFHKNKKNALIPGDYAYQRFASDANPNIRNLLSETYSAVIVPHHGDYESSKSVVSCIPDSPAFFSAGTHQGYNHPTLQSVNSHLTKNFNTIENKTEANIIKKTLM